MGKFYRYGGDIQFCDFASVSKQIKSSKQVSLAAAWLFHYLKKMGDVLITVYFAYFHTINGNLVQHPNTNQVFVGKSTKHTNYRWLNELRSVSICDRYLVRHFLQYR